MFDDVFSYISSNHIVSFGDFIRVDIDPIVSGQVNILDHTAAATLEFVDELHLFLLLLGRQDVIEILDVIADRCA